jgi:hypothetical protein
VDEAPDLAGRHGSQAQVDGTVPREHHPDDRVDLGGAAVLLRQRLPAPPLDQSVEDSLHPAGQTADPLCRLQQGLVPVYVCSAALRCFGCHYWVVRQKTKGCMGITFGPTEETSIPICSCSM